MQEELEKREKIIIMCKIPRMTRFKPLTYLDVGEWSATRSFTRSLTALFRRSSKIVGIRIPTRVIIVSFVEHIQEAVSRLYFKSYLADLVEEIKLAYQRSLAIF